MAERTGVVVVGGGPGGVLLAYLLARAGLRVVLLEGRKDFDRRFRGDSVAPPVLDYLHRFGLAEELLSTIPHGRATTFEWWTPDKRYTIADYRGSSPRFPYYALIPQARFLPFLVGKARRHTGFRVEMGARFTALLHDGAGRVDGVRYRRDGREHELRADLVVGADGRNSKVLLESDLTPTELASNIDICWFAVPRLPDDPSGAGQLALITEPGAVVGLLGQGDTWQIGFTLPAGRFGEVRAAGVEPLRDLVRRRTPWLGERVAELRDPNQLTLLPIRITEVDRWSRPGLLLIGDAAHVISPVGGNGINFAMIDAAEAANLLVGPLRGGDAEAIDVAASQLQRIRGPRVAGEQRMQVRVERGVARRLAERSPGAPLPIRLQGGVPGLARFSARRSLRALHVPPPSPDVLGPGASTVD
ncbi:FAD-dependent monooxygenase [Actinosynnema sp.]|uniref:FAD-dependent monooxygenase n=1 Tax=Actinosynnema sp. TaxID=1872144 RepID=UPI003F82461A